MHSCRDTTILQPSGGSEGQVEYQLDVEDWAQWLRFARKSTAPRCVRAVSYAVLGTSVVSVVLACTLLPELVLHPTPAAWLYLPLLFVGLLVVSMLVMCTVSAVVLGPLDDLVQTRRVRRLWRAGKLPRGRLRLAWSARGVRTYGRAACEIGWAKITSVHTDRHLVYLRRGRFRVMVVPRCALGESADELIYSWRAHVRDATPVAPHAQNAGPFAAPRVAP